MEKKSFSLGAALTLVGGKLLCPMADVYELANFVLGYPVWTHEFADDATTDKMRAAVLAQHPVLSDVDTSIVSRENVYECLATWESIYGKTLEFSPGSGQRDESPVESAERIFGTDNVVGIVR